MITTIVSRVRKLEQRLAPTVETEANRCLRMRLLMARSRFVWTAEHSGHSSFAATGHAGNRELAIAERLNEGRRRIVQARNPACSARDWDEA